MIHIKKSQEPECLRELRETEGTNYDDLQGECKKQVTELLSNDQGGLCAYCQRYLNPSVYIEHYIPQLKDGNSLELKYSNFLGVCSGKYYMDKMTGEHIAFCSVLRGSEVLSINPLVKESISTIFFNESNEIHSRDKKTDTELNETLNLNFIEICEDRGNQYNHFFKSFLYMGLKMKLSKIQILQKALTSLNEILLQNEFPEFIGFINFRINQAIEHKKTN